MDGAKCLLSHPGLLLLSSSFVEKLPPSNLTQIEYRAVVLLKREVDVVEYLADRPVSRSEVTAVCDGTAALIFHEKFYSSRRQVRISPQATSNGYTFFLLSDLVEQVLISRGSGNQCRYRRFKCANFTAGECSESCQLGIEQVSSTQVVAVVDLVQKHPLKYRIGGVIDDVQVVGIATLHNVFLSVVNVG